jgi:membrane-associated protease RseP (regulator of RpoE activity)
MSRLVGSLIVLLAGTALAEPPADPPRSEPAPAKADARVERSKLRLVRVMMDSEQVLLFDKDRGRYLAVEAGDTVAGYTVDRIDEDEVTLTGKSGTLVLALPEAPTPPAKAAPKTEPKPDARSEAKPTAKPAADATPGVVPEDPYADEPAEAAAPRESSAPREVGAPLDTSGETRSVSAAPPAPPAPSSAPATAPAKPERDVVDALLELQAEAARDAELDEQARTAAKMAVAATLSRKDVDAALRDFGALIGAVHGAFTPAGVRLDRVAAGSVFAKAGLRAGDVIVAVDGKPVRSLDDAADLYVAASAARAFAVQLQRAGKPLSLQVNIK